MNKDLLIQLPADEQPMASELTSVAEDMQLFSDFQWGLETQLMEAAKSKSKSMADWHRIMVPVGWAVFTICAVFLLNWAIRSLASNPPAATEMVPSLEPSFESDIRQGKICTGSLALAHDFSVFLTNADKTEFIELDEKKLVDELRTFAWSPDGSRLAIIANHQSRGDIYIHDFDRQLEYDLPIPNFGSLVNIAWSHDGKKLILQTVESRSTVYLMNADGTGSVEEISLGVQFFETPQFAPDGKSFVFNGNTGPWAGLIQLTLNDLQPQMASMGPPLQAENSFAWSPDGSRLAYFELMDTETFRLVVEEVDNGTRIIIGSLPVEETAGSSGSVNLSWSPDGKTLVFELANQALKRAIYFAHADGTGLVKVVDSAFAPTISSDGRCLAYISNDQVFLMDLTNTGSVSPIWMADLPPGQQNTNRADKLQWRP
jgi:WD40 repeat protein